MIDGEDLPSAAEMQEYALELQKQKAQTSTDTRGDIEFGEAAPVLPHKAQPVSRPPHFGRSLDRFSR